MFYIVGIQAATKDIQINGSFKIYRRSLPLGNAREPFGKKPR